MSGGSKVTHHDIPQCNHPSFRQMKPKRPQQNPINQIRYPTDIKHNIDNTKLHFNRIHNIPLPTRKLPRTRRNYPLHILTRKPIKTGICYHHSGDRQISSEIIRQDPPQGL